jgi:hypothetical protein
MLPPLSFGMSIGYKESRQSASPMSTNIRSSPSWRDLQSRKNFSATTATPACFRFTAQLLQR